MHVAFLALALPLVAPQLKGKPAVDPLVGRWEAISLVVSGNPDEQWQGLECEFRPDGREVIRRGGVELGGGPRTYKVDPKAKPAAIDLTEGETTYPGIYQFGPDADSLTVSFSYFPGGARPTDFAAAAGVMTITYKRVKPGK